MTMSTERTSPSERVFAGQTAVVVGSVHGIGRASATLLSRRGARAACLDRNLEGAQGLVDSLGSEAPEAVALEMDVTHERAVRATVSEAERRLGPDGVLVNCAGATGSPTGVPRTGILVEAAEMSGWILSPGGSFTAGFTFDLSGVRAVY